MPGVFERFGFTKVGAHAQTPPPKQKKISSMTLLIKEASDWLSY